MVRTLVMPGVLLKSDTPLGSEGLSLTPASVLCAPKVIPTVLVSDIIVSSLQLKILSEHMGSGGRDLAVPF